MPQAKFSFPLGLKNPARAKTKNVKKILLSAFCSERAGGGGLTFFDWALLGENVLNPG